MLGLYIFTLLTAVAFPAGERVDRVFLADGVSAVYPVKWGVDLKTGPAIMIMDSDSVFVEGRLLDRSGYVIDVENGRVVFFIRLPELTPVRVVYRYLSFREEEGRVGKPQVSKIAGVKGETLISVAKVDTLAAEIPGGWTISGNKSLGFSIGSSSGFGIDQATRIGLSGEVEDIKIEAELSDQSSPIPPEGTTFELEELDRIIITVGGSGWQGSFGDAELNVDAGGFGKLTRRSLGAVVKAEKGIFSLQGGYGRPRGEFGRVAFAGIDGVQGPYPVAPDGRSAEIVPGSEVVYLNGIKMVRGWDADYTIDYSTGEVIFTNRHVIDRRSRIEAEFQFVTESYERSGFEAGFKINPGVFQLSGGFFQEGDNPNRILSGDFSAEEKAMLGALGSDTNRAWLPGGKYVGAGKGDYIREDGFYRFVGMGNGDYRVQFTLRGDSLGNYVYDDTLLGFCYVGPHRGNYVDSVRVVLPKRNELSYGSLGVEYNQLRAAAEGIFTRRRVNLFAPNGGREDGLGLNLNLGWLDKFWRINYRHRVAPNGLAFPGATGEVDFAYRWAGIDQTERQMSDELAFHIGPESGWKINGEVGRLKKLDNKTLYRFGGAGKIGFISVEGSKVADLYRWGASIAPRIFWLYPHLGWKLEKNSPGRNRSWDVGVDWKPGVVFSGGAGFQKVNFDRADSAFAGWQGIGEGHIFDLNCELRLHDLLQISALGGYDQRVSYESPQANWNRIFGEARTTWMPASGIKMASDFSQSFRRVQLCDEQFRYVGGGRGEYLRDSITGNFVYHPGGDYERILVFLGRFTAARELSWNGVVEINRFEPIDFYGSFDRNWTRADTGILSEVLRLDTRSQLRFWGEVFVPTIGFNSERTIDRTRVVTGKGVSRYQGFVELTSDAIKGLEWRGRGERDVVIRRLVTGTVEYDERCWRFSLNPVLGARLRLEPGVALETKEISEPVAYPELGKFRLNGIECWMARSSEFTTKTKLRTKAGVIYRISSVGILPWDVALTQPLGVMPEISVELEHLFNETLSARGRYNFSDRPDKPAEHLVSFELRAYF